MEGPSDASAQGSSVSKIDSALDSNQDSGPGIAPKAQIARRRSPKFLLSSHRNRSVFTWGQSAAKRPVARAAKIHTNGSG